MPKINDPKELQEWVDNTETILADMKIKAEQAEKLEEENKTLKEEVTNLQKQVSDIGNLVVINKNAWHETDPKRKADYDFGKLLGAVQHRDVKSLHAMGVKVVLSNKAWKDMKIVSMDEAGKYLKIANNEYGEKAYFGEKGVLKADLGTPLTGDATGTDAQYLVPQTIYAETILRTLMVTSEIIPKFTYVPMTGRLIRYPVENTMFAFTFVTNEVTDKTEQTPDWTNKDLECETFAGWVGVTDELMEDTFAEIGGILRVQAVEAYQNSVESQLLDGSGSPFTGILRRSSSAQDYRISSTSIENVSWGDFKDFINKLTTQKKRQGAGFMMHPTVWDILGNEADAQGRYYHLPNVVVPPSIKGYPVWLSDNMPSISDDVANKAFIGFGNPKYSLYGVRMGMEIKYFTETYFAVQDDENFFRIRTRYAGVVGIPANYAVLYTAVS